ncbi:MAG: ribosome small subunit-dependent GTPase A [Leptospirales bacterium]|nr:ribosome small subunit-dependent GTPase A [Leptospirales bacterium]
MRPWGLTPALQRDARRLFPDLEMGRVLNVSRNQFALMTESGPMRCIMPGAVNSALTSAWPAVGDWVAFDASRVIRGILPRKSQLSRKVPGKQTIEQVIAANVDYVFVVQGLDDNFNVRRLERYLVMVRESRAEPVVILTKVDLCKESAERMAEARAVTQAPVLLVNGVVGEGLEAVRALLADGKTGALVGSSGAGKSTIINALLGDQKQKTFAVRSDSKGRHTTTTRQMFFLQSGGAIIDNPGMRELQLWTGTDTVAEVFPEIEELAADCRFRDCRHESEPGCAVQAGLTSGELSAERFESYRKLMREAAHLKVREDQSAMLKEKGKLKALHKVVRDVTATKRKYRDGLS